jgi:hypothetical protein
VETGSGEAWRRDVGKFVREVETQLVRVEGRIQADSVRTSLVLLSGLDYPYPRHINTARRIQSLHGAELPDPVEESLDALLRVLVVLASGREYFTTLYFKRELRNLSSDLLILSLPVIVFTAYVLLAIDANIFPELTLPGVAPRLLYVVVAFVVALSPYVLLSSYILRIVTVSKHSLESTVFTLEEVDDDRVMGARPMRAGEPGVDTVRTVGATPRVPAVEVRGPSPTPKGRLFPGTALRPSQHRRRRRPHRIRVRSWGSRRPRCR